MAVIDSLIAKLSFDFDDKALKQFDKGMKDAGKAIAIVAAGAATAGTAIFAFTSKIAEQNDEIGKTAKIIGITAQAISELGFVAELNGGSVDGMNSSLENLSKTSSEAARGLGAGVEAFGLLGISVTDAEGNLKKADGLLLDVADAVAQLDSQSQKLELLNKLGIDSSLLLSLEQGSAAIRKQREEVKALGFVLDKDAAESAAKFNDEMLRVRTVIRGVASSIGTKLMKQITPMVKAFLEWFKINKELIKQNLSAFFEKATKVIRGFFNVGVRVVRVIDSIVESMGGWKVALTGVAVAMTALNARALLMPTLIIAAGAAIFLLIEDLVAFANGADSQIGALTKRSEKFKIVMESLIEVFKMVRDGWDLIFSDGEKALNGLILLIKDVGSNIFNFLISPLNKAIELLNNIPGIDISTVQQMQTTGAVQAFASAPSGLAAQTTNSKSIEINISGGNIAEVKQAVAEALGSEFKATELNMSTPTRY